MEDQIDKQVEKAFAIGIQVGVINTLKELGLWEENVSENLAHKVYGERQVKEWRRKRWIVGYPSGNESRAKFYYKRSELETASRMLDYQNIIPPTKIKQLIDRSSAGK